MKIESKLPIEIVNQSGIWIGERKSDPYTVRLMYCSKYNQMSHLSLSQNCKLQSTCLVQNKGTMIVTMTITAIISYL